MQPDIHITKSELDRLIAIKKEVDPNGTYIGESVPILRVFERIRFLNSVRNDDGTIDPVLILGPTGAGKTRIAKLIHDHSGRKGFVEEQASSCAAADPQIWLGNWLGVGARSGLPGMRDGRSGLLQDANGGTIFLDELPEASQDFQTFIFRILDGKEVRHATGTGVPPKPNVRLIFATNRDPDEAVTQGILKYDLLRRLKDWKIEIPPLNKRKEDIFLFVQTHCGNYVPTPAFILALLNYSWPGNVGELVAVLRKASATAKQHECKKLTLDHLELGPEIITEVRGMQNDEIKSQVYCALHAMLSNQGLKKGQGLQNRMAAILKVKPSEISNKLKDYLSPHDDDQVAQ